MLGQNASWDVHRKPKKGQGTEEGLAEHGQKRKLVAILNEGSRFNTFELQKQP